MFIYGAGNVSKKRKYAYRAWGLNIVISLPTTIRQWSDWSRSRMFDVGSRIKLGIRRHISPMYRWGNYRILQYPFIWKCSRRWLRTLFEFHHQCVDLLCMHFWIFHLVAISYLLKRTYVAFIFELEILSDFELRSVCTAIIRIWKHHVTRGKVRKIAAIK